MFYPVSESLIVAYYSGHKVFTAQEAKRLLETQTVERRTVERFESNLDKLVWPRNPILGEETPRLLYDNKSKIRTQSYTLIDLISKTRFISR